MSESAKIVYGKVDKRYTLDMVLYPDNGGTTSMPLNKQLMESLIKLFSDADKIQKILGSME